MDPDDLRDGLHRGQEPLRDQSEGLTRDRLGKFSTSITPSCASPRVVHKLCSRSASLRCFASRITNMVAVVAATVARKGMAYP